MSWIKSNDKEIIGILNDLAVKAEASAKIIVDIFTDIGKLHELHGQIEKIESEADKLTHSIFEELNKTFITPLDREDILRIASKTDDIIDYLEGISGRLIGFKIKTPPPYMLEIAKEIHNSTKEINYMITKLNKVKADKSIIEHCRTVNQQEHKVDALYRKAMGELFETTDVLNIIKMKDTYEALENASDRCLDVADSIEDIVLKYT